MNEARERERERGKKWAGKEKKERKLYQKICEKFDSDTIRSGGFDIMHSEVGNE